MRRFEIGQEFRLREGCKYIFCLRNDIIRHLEAHLRVSPFVIRRYVTLCFFA